MTACCTEDSPHDPRKMNVGNRKTDDLFPGRTQWDRRPGLLSPFSLRFCGCSFVVGVCRVSFAVVAPPRSWFRRRIVSADAPFRPEPEDRADFLRFLRSPSGKVAPFMKREYALHFHSIVHWRQRGNGNRRHSHFLWKSRVAADESRSILPHPSFSARRGDSASRYHPRRSASRLSLRAEIPHVRFFRSPVQFYGSRIKPDPLSPRFSGEFRLMRGKKNKKISFI